MKETCYLERRQWTLKTIGIDSQFVVLTAEAEAPMQRMADFRTPLILEPMPRS